jgi:hypothetical protein
MKKLILSSIFIVFALIGFSQKATTFQKAIDSGISIKVLDSLYKPALSQGPDSLQAVFRVKAKEFHTHYVGLLKDLAKHLKDNGFAWSKQTRCFNRIYFNEQGTIDYFLFNFKPGEVDAVKAAQFETLLNAFIKTYTFTLPATAKFAQCSPVTYSD